MKKTSLKLNPNFFNQLSNKEVEQESSITKKIKEAMINGILLLNSENLTEIPEDLFKIDLDNTEEKLKEAHSLVKIDISDILIEKIPEDILKFTKFTKLVIFVSKNNQITEFPKHLLKLPSIKVIDLSKNRIKEISQILEEVPSLKELRLAENFIKEIPSSINKLKQLDVLDLSKNEISIFDLNLGFLLMLKHLNLGHNKLVSIPDTIGRLTQLEELFLNHNIISSISEMSLVTLSNLIILDLSVNQIQKLSEIPNSLKLLTLILPHNNILTIQNIKNSPNLITLDISYNKLESFPIEILDLKSIKFLNISYNSINQIPAEISKLEIIEKLNIEGNPLKNMHISSSIIKGKTEDLLKYLWKQTIKPGLYTIPIQMPMFEERKALKCSEIHSKKDTTNIVQEFSSETKISLNGLSLKSIEPKIFFSTFLNSIEFSNNLIEEIPEEIRFSQNLLFLDGSNNRLTNISMSVCYLKNLQTLDLSHNLIENFPKNLDPKCFQSLKKMNLNYNKIKNIPPKLRFCIHLEYLLLSNNEIESIEEISKYDFPSLEMYEISNNQIEVIPNEFSIHFPKLEVLKMANNKIKNLPFSLGGLLNLKDLDVTGNPISNIEPSLVTVNSSILIEFLGHSLKTQNEEKSSKQ